MNHDRKGAPVMLHTGYNDPDAADINECGEIVRAHAPSLTPAPEEVIQPWPESGSGGRPTDAAEVERSYRRRVALVFGDRSSAVEIAKVLQGGRALTVLGILSCVLS